jgi:hypothetical protein
MRIEGKDIDYIQYVEKDFVNKGESDELIIYLKNGKKIIISSWAEYGYCSSLSWEEVTE